MTTLQILHRDSRVVVVAKPSGLLVHPGGAPDRDTALSRARDALGQWVYPVHRLDRGTSGALAFALDPDAASLLAAQFGRGEVGKRYLALVRGVPEETGVVDHPVPRRDGGSRVPAVTHYRRLGTSPHDRCSLVEAMPQTGRYHQIRRHFRHLSHHLVGDVKYGKGDINRRFRATWGLHRLALHAIQLAFLHPDSGARIRVAAPVPPDLGDALRALDLWPAA